MKLVKRGRIYHAQFQTMHGLKSVSTKCTDKEAAAKVARDSGLSDLEHAAKAGVLTAQAVGKALTGRKLTIEKAIEHYRRYLVSVGKSPKTIENNVTTVEQWAKAEKVLFMPPCSVTEDFISIWVNRKSDIKASTRQVNLAALRSFFGYCAAKGWTVGDPARLVRVTMDNLNHFQKERSIRQTLSADEVTRLCDELQRSGQTFWLFAVRLSLETGLRLGDICRLEWECFTEADRINVWTDKRDKRVSVPISATLSNMVSAIPVTSHRYLFPEEFAINSNVKRRSYLSVAFARVLQKCGIEGKSFHCIRHTCITAWKSEGKTLESIAELVGHSNTKTTEGYVHL